MKAFLNKFLRLSSVVLLLSPIACTHDIPKMDYIAVQNLDYRWGFISPTGEEKIAFIYDNAHNPKENLAAVRDSLGNWGFIDANGAIKVPFEYAEVNDFSEGLAAVKRYADWGYVNQKGEEIIPCALKRARPFREGLAAVADTSWNWGFIDPSGAFFMPCIYLYCGDFHDGRAVVKNYESKYGMVDQTGHPVLPFEYDYLDPASEGLISAKKDGKWGYINPQGEVVVNFVYETAFPFQEGFGRVMKSRHKWGFVNAEGTEAIPCQYVFAKDFNDGYAAVMDNAVNWPGYKNTSTVYGDEIWGFINQAGELVMDYQWSGVWPVHEGQVYVQEKENLHWGRTAIPGDADIHFDYLYAGKTREDGLTPVRDSSYRCGFLDSEGQVVIPFQYKGTAGFGQSLAICGWPYEYFYADTEGHRVFSSGKVTHPTALHDGFIPNRLNGRRGLLDYTGELLVPMEFGYNCDAVVDYRGHIAFAYDGDTLCFNRKGEMIPLVEGIFDYFQETEEPFESEVLFPFTDSTTVQKDYNRTYYLHGYKDEDGNVVLPAIYHDAGPFKDGKALVHIDNDYMLIDLTGKVLYNPDKDRFFSKEYSLRAGNYHEGIATFTNSHYHTEFYNSRGERINDKSYYFAEDFNEGYASFASNGKKGFIDRAGHVCLELDHYKLDTWMFYDGICCLMDTREMRSGFIDYAGRELIPFSQPYFYTYGE